ncbi:MAG TPA: xanthine dehydrogenase accessory protein XdhC [Alphaproteobacteria bacterium]|nr:xanthine dehydrogenase accessory protein XdhC [Alphaproteobacteria bacterium]
MSEWLDHIGEFERRSEPVAIATVIRADGSTPRGVGARILVGADWVKGTIGGGTLEYRTIALAREMLSSGEPARREALPLGPALGQCCGGQVAVLLERIGAEAVMPAWIETLRAAQSEGEPAVIVTDLNSSPVRHLTVTPWTTGGDKLSGHREAVLRSRRMLAEGADSAEHNEFLYEAVQPKALRLTLFGAGHVGRALVNVLAGVPAHVDWVDSRAEQFPEDLPGNAFRHVTEDYEAKIDAAPRGSFFLVMTHSHAIDLEIVETVLRRGDFTYLGLIGSATKRARFERQLRSRGLTDQHLERLTCPIGIEGVSGKAPAVIAVAVAAEILRKHDQRMAAGEIERSA